MHNLNVKYVYFVFIFCVYQREWFYGNGGATPRASLSMFCDRLVGQIERESRSASVGEEVIYEYDYKAG